MQQKRRFLELVTDISSTLSDTIVVSFFSKSVLSNVR